MNRFKSIIGVLGMSLLLFLVACVKEVADNDAQFQLQKSQLLKSKAEMTQSFRSVADATRATGKKYFGTPHNGAAPDERAFLDNLTQELTRQRPDFSGKTEIRLTKVWNPKSESLSDYMSANGVSEKVIAYSNTLKTNLEAAGAKFEGQINQGQFESKEMLASVNQVFQDMEKNILEDRNLTESEKLTLLASTTAGTELTSAWVDVYQDFKFNLINKKEGWAWLRALGNAIITIAIIVAVVVTIAAIVVAIGAGTAGVGWAAIGAFFLTTQGTAILGGGAAALYGVLFDCRGVCVFPDDDCYCH